MKKLLLIMFIALSLQAKEYTLNFKGLDKNENFSVKLDLEVDEDSKPIANQKFDIQGLDKIRSLKIVIAPGLLATLKNELSIVAYYKTSLNIGGMKIRNLYKVANGRIYEDEAEINNITFDPDHYQNIISYLRYYNVNQETVKHKDNLYGVWSIIDVPKEVKEVVDTNTTTN